MLINVLDQIQPDFVLTAMDDVEPTFRVEEFTGYKAHRKPMEDDLSSQIPKVFEVIDAFGVKRVSLPGYEADDVIGTMIDKYGDKNTEVIVVSNDRDLWQLVGGNVMVMSPGSKGVSEWIGEKEVLARYGFSPKQIPEYKGLRGDSSDNIPGVYGIGEKTAKKLIYEYKNIDEVYKNIDKIEPKSLRDKLLNGYEQAMMSKNLATIIRNAPMDVSLKECEYHEANKENLKEVLEKYNFKSLIRRLDKDEEEEKKSKTKDVPENQMKLL
jgi:DNA polymerase-1